MFMSEVDHEKYPEVIQKYRFELKDYRSLLTITKKYYMCYYRF